MPANITITTGTGVASYSITTSGRGPAGPPGADGNSADITAESIADALGYVPADADNLPAVDNAAVNAAMAEDAAASRNSLNALERNTNLRGLKNSITAAAGGQNLPVSAILLGDSFAATGALYSGLTQVTRIVGAYRCGAITGGGDSGVTTISDYSRSPSGTYQRITDGGNMTAGHLSSGLQGPASIAYYTFFPGTGSAQIQYRKGAGSWTNLGSPINTASITNVSVGSIALPDASSNYGLRVTATGGDVNGWIGQGLDGPGLTIIDFATSGQQIEQSADINEAVWRAMINGYKSSGVSAQIVMCAFADYRFTSVATTSWPTKGIESWGPAGPAQVLHDWSAAENASVDWVIIGPHQVSTAENDPIDAPVDAAFSSIGIGQNLNERIIDGSRAQREFAVRNKTAWIDCLYITDYATGQPEGLYGDTVHLSAKGQNYKRSLLFKETNLGWLLNASSNAASLRLGSVLLASTATRSSSPSVVAYLSSSVNSALAPITASNFRVGDSATPEQAGMQFTWHSASTARIGAYSSAGPNSNALELSYNGAAISIRPTISASSQCGTAALPWAQVNTQRHWTGAQHTGYVAVSANYTVLGTDHTIHCTSGTFNVTLPLVFSAVNDAYANKGRIIEIVNTGAGTITVLTGDSGGGVMQKIDTATSLALTAGQKVRLMSTGNLSAASDYNNWISLT
jgi:hypothetical protein